MNSFSFTLHMVLCFSITVVPISFSLPLICLFLYSHCLSIPFSYYFWNLLLFELFSSEWWQSLLFFFFFFCSQSNSVYRCILFDSPFMISLAADSWSTFLALNDMIHIFSSSYLLSCILFPLFSSSFLSLDKVPPFFAQTTTPEHSIIGTHCPTSTSFW